MTSIHKMPSKIKLKILKKAPIVTSNENSGRRFGDFTDYDIDSRAYNNVLFYIQKGLSSYSELIKAILKPILQMQLSAAIKYTIIPFTFGIDDEPFYKGRCLNINYQPSISKISKILLKLSGNKRSQKIAIIPRLFPESTVANSYSGGKTRIKRKEDLLIVIGKKGEVFFDELIREEVEKYKKQILFVEIENENVDWYFYNYQPEFLVTMRRKTMDTRKANFKIGTFHGKLNPIKSDSEAKLRNDLYLIGSLTLERPRRGSNINIRIIGYEMPLVNEKKRGEAIDLFGYDKEHKPYIIELKKANTNEKIEEIIEQIDKYENLLQNSLKYIEKEIQEKYHWNDFKFTEGIQKVILIERSYFKNNDPKRYKDEDIYICSFSRIPTNDNLQLLKSRASEGNVNLKIENK
ncbi:MAG: hypothetical protein K8S23_04475 [Candidatus Cloacimonetes bacterium]|nr:hypothetical protein [Candidatus Cloacimonadota bacterium]